MDILLADSQLLTQLGIYHFIIQDLHANIHQITTFDDLCQRVGAGYDILIVDPYYGNDDFTIEKLLTIVSSSQIIIISNHLDKPHIVAAIQANIPVYLSKGCQPNEILQAINAIRQNERFFCSRTVQVLFDHDLPPSDATVRSLTPREAEIVRLIAQGCTDKEIANNLFLSFHTIRTHRKNICKKLGFSLKNAAELVWLLSYFNDLI